MRDDFDDLFEPPEPPSADDIKGAWEMAELTQRQPAGLVYISPKTLADYERGRYAMPLDRWQLLRQKLQEISERKMRAAWEARQQQIRREKRRRPTKLARIVDDFCARQ